MTLQEEIRPRTIEDFIGNEDSIQLVRAYMEDRAPMLAALFHGQPGTGKTTLAHIMAKEYNLEPVEINASDKTSRKSKKEIVTQVRSISLDGKPKLLILDEAENADPGLLIDLLQLRTKKIVIVNEIHELLGPRWKLGRDEVWKLHNLIKKNCQHVIFDLPGNIEYQQLLGRLGLEDDEAPLDEFNSFRDVLNWVEGGDSSSPLIYTELEEARQIFTGNPPNKIQMEPERLLEYYTFNGGELELASQIDLLLRRKRKLAFRILKTLTLPYLVQPPYKHRSKGKKGNYRKEIRLVVIGFDK